jgi:hypothetical protein
VLGIDAPDFERLATQHVPAVRKIGLPAPSWALIPFGFRTPIIIPLTHLPDEARHGGERLAWSSQP